MIKFVLLLKILISAPFNYLLETMVPTDFSVKFATRKVCWNQETRRDTILVGGAVVSIYSNGAYRSGDLDFVRASMFVTKRNSCNTGCGFIILNEQQ